MRCFTYGQFNSLACPAQCERCTDTRHTADTILTRVSCGHRCVGENQSDSCGVGFRIVELVLTGHSLPTYSVFTLPSTRVSGRHACCPPTGRGPSGAEGDPEPRRNGQQGCQGPPASTRMLREVDDRRSGGGRRSSHQSASLILPLNYNVKGVNTVECDKSWCSGQVARFIKQTSTPR